MGLFSKKHNIDIDIMTGEQFEEYCADILRSIGFRSVTLTKHSQDHGADIIATKGMQKYIIQCKRYSSAVGNKAIQEAYSAKAIYGGNVALVLTSNYFTKQAIEDAQKLSVELWDRDILLRYATTTGMKHIPARVLASDNSYAVTSFTDCHGQVHYLDKEISTNPEEIKKLERKYVRIANMMMHNTGKSVFYELKLPNRCNFFSIPIEEEDIESIAKKYGDRFYIGIIHKGLVYPQKK